MKSLVKICSQPTNEETLAVDHKKITCPTAVFWALHDAWMPKESGERLKQDIAGPVRLQFIEREFQSVYHRWYLKIHVRKSILIKFNNRNKLFIEQMKRRYAYQSSYCY